MQARTQSLLALALGAALLSPVAMAQGGKSVGPSLRGTVDSTMQSVPAPRATEAGKAVRDSFPAAAVDRVGGKASARAGVEARSNATGIGTDAGASLDADTSVDTAMRAAAPSKVARDAVFGQLDSDGDGVISTAEAAADATFQGRFATIDADGDGRITADEYKAFARTQVPPAPPAHAQGSAHAAGHASVVQRSTFAGLDTDADGRISAAEAEADAEFSAAFATLDADGDGAVTDAEFRAHAKAASTGGTP